MANSVPEPGQNLVPSYKHKTKENLNKLARPKNELAVLIFFKENNWPAIEGEKFYNYYKSMGWKLRGDLRIKNWQAHAKKYVEKGYEIKQEAAKPISGYRKNIKRVVDKNYYGPL